jgi:DNA-binding NarL/FixJ family response regulator
MNRPRVFIVDDHELIRAGLRSELSSDVEIVGEADEVTAAIEMINERTPDVVLLDIHMPDGGGLAVLNGVTANPDVRFLALSVSDAAEDVIAAVRSGARGYLTKNITAVELLDAIRRVAEGDVVFSPRLAGFVLDAFSDRGGAPGALGVIADEVTQLTPREREVLRYIARGYSYREIGEVLAISARTVESHVSSVLRKLQLSNRHQLSNWAVEHRLS